MKKIFLAAVMCLITMTAMGQQIKSIEAKANLRGDFGIGAGFTMPIWEQIDFAPNFNYYFSDGTIFTLDADFHYNFDMDRNWTLYPLVGLIWFHAADGFDATNSDYNKIGVNIGGGARYNIDRNWAAFAEAKYQWVTDFDDSFFTLGVSYSF